MNTAMIPVASDVLARLLTLRRSERESLDEVLRRVLPPAKPRVPSAERAMAATPMAAAFLTRSIGKRMWRPMRPRP